MLTRHSPASLSLVETRTNVSRVQALNLGLNALSSCLNSLIHFIFEFVYFKWNLLGRWSMHWGPSAGTLVCPPAALPHLPVIGSQHPVPYLPDDSCPTPSRPVAPRCDALEGDFAQVSSPLSSSSCGGVGGSGQAPCALCVPRPSSRVCTCPSSTPQPRGTLPPSFLPLLNLASVCHLWPMESTLYS